MMVDPLPAALHIQSIQSIQRQHYKYTLTSGRAGHQEGRLGMSICSDMLLACVELLLLEFALGSGKRGVGVRY